MNCERRWIGVGRKSVSESVFPQPKIHEYRLNGDPMQTMYPAGGLTKREMFAATCAQGLLSGNFKILWPHTPGETRAQWYAIEAVMYADALLAELAKEKP